MFSLRCYVGNEFENNSWYQVRGSIYIVHIMCESNNLIFYTWISDLVTYDHISQITITQSYIVDQISILCFILICTLFIDDNHSHNIRAISAFVPIEIIFDYPKLQISLNH